MILSMLNLLYDCGRIAADVAPRTRTAIMAVCGVVGKAEWKKYARTGLVGYTGRMSSNGHGLVIWRDERLMTRIRDE